MGVPKDTWVIYSYGTLAALHAFPVSKTTAPTNTTLVNPATLPYTSPASYTGSVGLRTGSESTLSRSFTFTSPNDGCVLSYSVTGTPGNGGGYYVVAYNARTNAVIPLRTYSTWGASWNKWSATAGTATATTLSLVSSGFNSGNGGSLLVGSPTTTPASGQVTVTASLASADAAANSITTADLTAGNIAMVVYYVDNNGTTYDTVNDMSMTCTGGTAPTPSYTVTAGTATGAWVENTYEIPGSEVTG